MANRLKGSEPMVVISARVEPTSKQELIDKHGSVQKAVDFLVNITKQLGGKNGESTIGRNSRKSKKS